MLWQRRDLRDGVRTLRRQPAFTLAAIVTFALGIGTTTAIFAALDAVILTPLPFAEPSALIVAWHQDPARAQPVVEVSHRQFREWQARAQGFASSPPCPRSTPGHLDARGRRAPQGRLGARLARVLRVLGAAPPLAARSCPRRIASTPRHGGARRKVLDARVRPRPASSDAR